MNNEHIDGNANKIERLYEMCETYSDKSRFEELYEQFAKFADIETIKELEETYLPKIESTCASIDKF